MASLSQCRALAGCKAFTGVRPAQARRVANGSRVFMKKKDSYMVEVEVGDEEPEDAAVRRFMKQVMQSRVIEKLRSRKTKETKIEEYKRRFRERCEARKLGIEEPTWEELYPADMDPKPFDDFFMRRDENDPEGAFDGYGLPGDDIFGAFGTNTVDANTWGAYMDPTADANFAASQPQQGWGQGAYLPQ